MNESKLKVVILAGGYGKRLNPYTLDQPKPLLKIGNMPIMLHIMKYYLYFGYNEFFIALGYKSEKIREWMNNYAFSNPNILIKNGKEKITYIINKNYNCKIHLLDTGLCTKTGGRIKRLAPWLKNETFMMTWCDGLINLNINKLLTFHKTHGKLATITAVRPPPRFGHLKLKGNKVIEFKEKPKITEYWINGAYFVLEPEVINYIKGDETIWENEPLENLAIDGQLMAYKHHGFWQCMDTIYEKEKLSKMYNNGEAPWKVW
jgi:glucose-1-phosphate cytidylyltransferase